MVTKFKIVVPSFNSVAWIGKTLDSIAFQTDKNFDVCVIDDGSTVKGQKEIIQSYAQKYGWLTHFHEKNEGVLYGIVHAIPDLQCEDEDVILVIDGDDWLLHERVFETLRKVYDAHDPLLTWGRCELYPPHAPPVYYGQPVPEFVLTQKLCRQFPFVFWQLRSFKYKIWKYLLDADLRDHDGEYFRTQQDKAIMFPLLEMAGTRAFYVDEPLYVYNIGNPLNDFECTATDEHHRVDAYIRNLPKYALLDSLKT